MTIVTQSLFPRFEQIFGSKIPDFFQTFSKTTTSFSRLTLIKYVSKRDLKRNKALSMMHCKRTGKIENDLTNRKKISLVKHLLQLEKKKFTIFSRLYLYFPDFFQVQKIAGQISKLFQEFKTLYRPCLSSFKISLKKYIINSYKSKRFEQFSPLSQKFTCPSITIFVICNICLL